MQLIVDSSSRLGRATPFVQMICSAAGMTPPSDEAGLLSPPRNWPASFKNAAMQAFLGKTIKGKRARLTALPSAAIKEEAAAVHLLGDDCAISARLFDALGWKTLTGFAIYELDSHPGVFVAKKRCCEYHESPAHPIPDHLCHLELVA